MELKDRAIRHLITEYEKDIEHETFEAKQVSDSDPNRLFLLEARTNSIRALQENLAAVKNLRDIQLTGGKQPVMNGMLVKIRDLLKNTESHKLILPIHTSRKIQLDGNSITASNAAESRLPDAIEEGQEVICRWPWPAGGPFDYSIQEFFVILSIAG
jgi:hypothetical protein